MNIGDEVLVYFHLDQSNKTPRIYIVWAYPSVKDLRSGEQAVCEVTGIIREKSKDLNAGGILKIEITDLGGFNKVQFGENNFLKPLDTLEFEVSHNRLFEKLK